MRVGVYERGTSILAYTKTVYRVVLDGSTRQTCEKLAEAEAVAAEEIARGATPRPRGTG